MTFKKIDLIDKKIKTATEDITKLDTASKTYEKDVKALKDKITKLEEAKEEIIGKIVISYIFSGKYIELHLKNGDMVRWDMFKLNCIKTKANAILIDSNTEDAYFEDIEDRKNLFTTMREITEGKITHKNGQTPCKVTL